MSAATCRSALSKSVLALTLSISTCRKLAPAPAPAPCCSTGADSFQHIRCMVELVISGSRVMWRAGVEDLSHCTEKFNARIGHA